MAHSLFEPAPMPMSEKLWQHMKKLNTGLSQRMNSPRGPIATTGPDLLQQADGLDARGRQKLLEAILAAKPLSK